MPDFKQFMMRHGEHAIQYVVEQIEKVEGVKLCTGTLLEDRWHALRVSTANDAQQETK